MSKNKYFINKDHSWDSINRVAATEELRHLLPSKRYQTPLSPLASPTTPHAPWYVLFSYTPTFMDGAPTLLQMHIYHSTYTWRMSCTLEYSLLLHIVPPLYVPPASTSRTGSIDSCRYWASRTGSTDYHLYIDCPVSIQRLGTVDYIISYQSLGNFDI